MISKAPRQGPRDAFSGDLGAAASTLRAFLGDHATVAVREGGNLLARLRAEDSGFSISTESGKLVCHFWGPDANLVRRVVGISGTATAARLRLHCLRMGRSRPEIMVLEDGGGNSLYAEDRQERGEFRQAVVAAAQRDWHGWRLESGGAARATHSPYQRLLFRRGQSLAPCLAVDEREAAGAAAAALAEALVWTEQVRTRWPAEVIESVRLILPQGSEDAVSARRLWLRAPPEVPAITCYRLDRSAGQLDPVALSDCGNFLSDLRRAVHASPPPDAVAPEAAALLATMQEICPQTVLELGPSGAYVFRLYGLEIARQAEGAAALVSAYTFGCGREQSPVLETTRTLLTQFLRELAAQRVPGGDRRDPWYRMQPERWMEHLLRSDLGSLDPAIDRRFVYAQVPLRVRGQQDVLDLLAVDRGGRLLVLELKANEDLGFPLQALDYWLRVRDHLLAGDFERLGYFPGIELSRLPPRLWLVAPALRWHPQTAVLTRWISPQVPWTRIGINEEWRRGLQIVYHKDVHSA